MIGTIKDAAHDVVHEVQESWHLNKGVSVLMMVIVGIQTVALFAGGGWYAGRNEQRMHAIENRLDLIPTKIPPQEVDNNFDSINNDISEVKNELGVVKNNQGHIMGTVNAIAERLNVIPPGPNRGPQ